jgi:hypothetical protein
MRSRNRGELAVQALSTHELSEEQADWLRRILESQPRRTLFDRFAIPDDVRDALAEKGLVRRWRNGAVEITLDGILEVTRRRPNVPDAASVATPADRSDAA